MEYPKTAENGEKYFYDGIEFEFKVEDLDGHDIEEKNVSGTIKENEKYRGTWAMDPRDPKVIKYLGVDCHVYFYVDLLQDVETGSIIYHAEMVTPEEQDVEFKEARFDSFEEAAMWLIAVRSGL